MRGLSAADVAAIRRFNGEAAELGALGPEVLELVVGLIPGDYAGVDALDFERRRLLPECSWWCADPCWDDQWEYPVAEYRRRHGFFGALTLRDVLGSGRWRAHPTDPAYDPTDEISVCLSHRFELRRDVTVTRERGRFSERDHVVLDLIRPQLALLVRDQPRDEFLTAREREVLALVRQGRANKQIARELSIAPGTVRKHLENIYAKLEVTNRTEAARLIG